MNGLSPKDLTGKARRKWAEERRKLYRAVLKDPRSTKETKERARKKISETYEPPPDEGL